MRRLGILVLTGAMASAACRGSGLSGPSSSSNPATVTPSTSTGPAISRIDIEGLPAPLLYDIPSSLKAGSTYTPTATATFSDGTSAVLSGTAVAWQSSDSSIASFEGGALRANREGAVTITARALTGPAAARSLTVRSSASTIREDRAESVPCNKPHVCPYPYCPVNAPYWLFPVNEGGPIQILSVTNPGWGSPSNYVTQLSTKGEYIRSWLLFPFNPQYGTDQQFLTATVPGGYMYLFTMTADLAGCGAYAASWTRPN